MSVDAGVEVLDPDNGEHVGRVATLLQRLDPAAPARFARSRLAFARRLCRWTADAEELARFAVRVIRRTRPDNLLAYLRESAKAGDPGQLLRSQLRNEIGRGAERFCDLSMKAERAIEGEHLNDVQRIVVGTASVLGAAHGEHRERLRLELRRLLALNPRGAGRLLRMTFRHAPSDLELHRLCDGVCTVAQAREALAA